MKFMQQNVFDLRLPQRSQLVYADPPYANCRFQYARQNNSRQWGKNTRADFLRELIAVMEWHRAENGVCALSMASPELKLLSLFPTNCRVFAWCKPYAPHRPNVWPTYAWEPVVAWGTFPDRADQKRSKTPHDWLLLPPAKPGGEHETPKPEAFGDWICELTLGPRTGHVLELFAGPCPISTAAIARGCQATAVDLTKFKVQNRLKLNAAESELPPS